jgi:hypothetical protein
MARIALYVPDELKNRMDAVPEDQINWSDIARPALTAAVAAFEHSRGKNVSTAIERLRASKQQADQQDKLEGNAHGRAWAEHAAEYRTLRELCFRRTKYPSEDPYHLLKAVLDPLDDIQPDDFDELIRFPRQIELKDEPWEDEYVVRPSMRSDEYLLAFVDGAVGFFNEVRAEVEKQREQPPKLVRRRVNLDD